MVYEAHVVIGAGYGDEGKGLITHYKCKKLSAMYKNVVNIRFNGGAQAAHTTYEEKNGLRHVFNTMGSGTFTGARTHLSEHFLYDPIMFEKELNTLDSLGILYRKPTLSPTAFIVTPIDVMLNQTLEEMRGTSRHGSCGMGIGEAVERSLNSDYDFVAGNLCGNLDAIFKRLIECWVDYIPKRVKQLEMWDYIETSGCKIAFFKDYDYAVHALKNWLIRAREMLDCISLVSDASIAEKAQALVFEGAQGLKLDQTNGAFPHVTRSNTGLKNVDAMCKVMNVYGLKTTYVTRAYRTRHGAGPLANEIDCLPSAKFEDLTNLPNAFQGNLRFGWLNPAELQADIHNDLQESKRVEKWNVALTCCDQIEKTMPVFVGGKLKDLTVTELTNSIKNVGFQSWGPRVKDVKENSGANRFAR